MTSHLVPEDKIYRKLQVCCQNYVFVEKFSMFVTISTCKRHCQQNLSKILISKVIINRLVPLHFYTIICERVIGERFCFNFPGLYKQYNLTFLFYFQILLSIKFVKIVCIHVVLQLL